MRLWTLSPKYLDTKGLIAVWREALLAKHVLEGKTKGYVNHPQLERFKASISPLTAINAYLSFIYDESQRRGYLFNKNKFITVSPTQLIPVTKGQVLYEFSHLCKKLEARDTVRFLQAKQITFPEVVPIFTIIPGDKESWEKTV